MTRNLIEITKDGKQWCAMYPFGSNIMECKALAFSPEDKRWNKHLGREIDYGKHAVIQKLKNENPNLPTHSFYCDENYS